VLPISFFPLCVGGWSCNGWPAVHPQPCLEVRAPQWTNRSAQGFCSRLRHRVSPRLVEYPKWHRKSDLLPIVPPANSPLLGSQQSFVLASSSGKNLKGLNLRRAADGSELHPMFATVSLRLSRIPAMIKLKMTAANSSSQPQYWDGWRRTRTKWRP